MKKCPYCDTIHPDTSNYCQNCGGKMEVQDIITLVKSEENDTFFIENYPNRKKYIISIALYFGFFYILSSIISIVVAAIWQAINRVPIGDPFYNEKFETDVIAWTNFLTYVVALAVIVPILYQSLKKDVKLAIKEAKYNLKWTLYGIGIMYLAIYIAGIIVTILTFGMEGTSENQETINTILNSGGINLVLIAILTVIFAPILEELIFRKCLFGLFRKNTIKTVIISSIIFASIHVVPACLSLLIGVLAKTASITDLYLEFIYIFSYIGQAFAISFVYHKTKGNIVPSILIHMFNNLVSLIINLW